MAITSNTDICKLSLDLLKGGLVSDITSPTTSLEEACFRWYDHNRRKLLRQHPWNFAIRRIILAASATAPVFGASEKFPLPSDCLRVLRIVTEDNRILGANEYYLEDKAIMLRFAEDSSVRLIYITDEVDVTRFDDLFTDLLAVEIALSMSYLVTESNGNFDKLTQMRKTLISAAKAVDGQEQPPESRRSSESIRARRTLGVYNNTRYEF